MPEGPSLVLLREELARFEGEIVKRVAGNTKIDLTRMLHRRVRSVRTWGKHLLFEFDDFSLRIHLLLYGRCRVATLPARVEAIPAPVSLSNSRMHASTFMRVPRSLSKEDWTMPTNGMPMSCRTNGTLPLRARNCVQNRMHMHATRFSIKLSFPA